jgi:signal peptidase I
MNENNEHEEFEIKTNESIKGKMFAEQLFEWLETFSFAMILLVLAVTFMFKLVTVDGRSMEETLHDGDQLIISNFFYTPKQNDIVVIHVTESEMPIIKRVIATEGQTVDFDFDNWQVIVDGEVIDEPYVNYETGAPMNAGSVYSIYNLPLTVEKDKIFVLGDNRNRSRDSRDISIQQVDTGSVAGRVLVRLAPLGKFGLVKPAS